MGRVILAMLAFLAMAGMVATPVAALSGVPPTAGQPCHHHDRCDGCDPAHDHAAPGCALHCVGVLVSSMSPSGRRRARADPPAEARPLPGRELPPPLRPPIPHRSA